MNCICHEHKPECDCVTTRADRYESSVWIVFIVGAAVLALIPYIILASKP